jgi:hypothetical protein
MMPGRPSIQSQNSCLLTMPLRRRSRRRTTTTMLLMIVKFKQL